MRSVVTVLALPFVATVLDCRQASHFYSCSGNDKGKLAANISTDLNNVKGDFC